MTSLDCVANKRVGGDSSIDAWIILRPVFKLGRRGVTTADVLLTAKAFTLVLLWWRYRMVAHAATDADLTISPSQPPRTQTRGEERLTAGKKNVKDEKGEERRDEGGVTA